MKKINLKPNLLTIVLLINLAIVSFWLLNTQYFQVHDTTSGARIFELNQTLRSGQFPPRWSANFGFGAGMPLFQFYAPLAFLVAQFFHFLNFSILSSLKISYLISTILGFFGAYFLGKEFTNKKGGLIAATAFTLAPYHAVNLYVRGATSEYWAISLIPFCIYFLIKLLQKPNVKNYTFYSLFLTGIFLSHNITTLTFIPFLGLIILGFFILKPKLKNLIILSLASIHSFLLSSWFLIPAFLQKNFTRVEDITEGYSQYNLHFLYYRQLFKPNWKYGGSVFGIEDDMSFYLGKTIIVLAVLGLLVSVRKLTKKSFVPVGIFALAMLSIFLTNFKSQLIWQRIPLVNFIQFPWRFLGISSFLLAILAAFAIKTKFIKKYLYYVLAILFIFNGFFFRPKKIIDPGDAYRPTNEYVQSYMSTILPDYLPPGVDWGNLEPSPRIIEIPISQELLRLEGIYKIDNNYKLKKQQVPDYLSGLLPGYLPPGVDIVVVKNTTNQLLVDIETPISTTIVINKFFFPNWEFYLDQQSANCYKNDLSTYDCQIPAGEHQLEMIWSEKGINQLSNYLSLFGFVALLALMFLKPKLS